MIYHQFYILQPVSIGSPVIPDELSRKWPWRSKSGALRSFKVIFSNLFHSSFHSEIDSIQFDLLTPDMTFAYQP